MLRELRIRDIAIVDDLALTFGPGLNVLTGETGAGKSIILQSLAVLCGARASTDLIRSEATEACVEGLFDVALPSAQRDALGVGAADDELLVRRHLARTGKGRVAINGGPVTVAMLAQLGDSLVHIYGQHDQALLLRPASQRELLDRYGELDALGRRMAAAAGAWAAARDHLDDLERRRLALAERRDLLDYQHGELTAAAVLAGEEAELRRERELLRHGARLQQVCGEGESALYSGDGAIAATLARLRSQLGELGDVVPALAGAAQLIENGRLQLEEAALLLRAEAARMRDDPERLAAVEDRLALLSRLARKYAVGSDELPVLCARIEQDRRLLETAAADLTAARADADARRADAWAIARQLSAARRAAAARLEADMQDELAALGMGGAVFRVRWETRAEADAEALTADGCDRIEFVLAANPGEDAKPLARVASGGELSRIMLALKALTADASETPILIFDEVDAGIGGTVADAVAKRLKALARTRQVLCITHLPQIAAHADHHFAVEKRAQRGRTTTRARALAATERVAEVARMLGGATAPAEAARYAQRLIDQARRAP